MPIAIPRSLPAMAILFAAMLARPAMAAGDAAIPDFSGFWGRNAFDLEPVPGGNTPVLNRQYLPEGTGDPQRPVADYDNPLLKPGARDIVKERSELSAAGQVFPDPSNQCAPQPVPFIFGMELGVQMFQGTDRIVFLYNQDNQIRFVRLNGTHPVRVVPSWKGDSVAHYEGDTLVIDTVGVKTGPLAVIDRYGTPFSAALHVVERYHLIDAKDAKDAQQRQERTAGRVGAMPIDIDYPKGLQLQLTIEDPVMLTAPLEARITYRRTSNPWQELICADNAVEYYSGKRTPIPTADKPDF